VLLGRAHLARQCASGGEYYFQIHLRHLLAPFSFWRPLIPLSVALLRFIHVSQNEKFAAHLGAFLSGNSIKRVGGRICGCAKLLAGTLRCLRLVDFSLGVGLTRNSWGVAPKPTRGATSGLRKGEKEKRRSLPLDTLCAIELFSLPLLLPRVALLGGIPIPYHFMNQVEIYPVLPSTSTLHQSVPCSSTFTSVPTGTRASTSAFSDAPFRKFT